MDKREVNMLSTRPDTDVIDVQRRSRTAEGGIEIVKKPRVEES